MKDTRLAGAWLAQHGLDDTQPTAELATRLAVRRIASIVDSLMLAAFIIGLALVQVSRLGPDEPGPLPWATLAALVGAVLLVRFLLDRWVRAVDRRAAAGLVRRATLPVPPGWRAIVGVPHLAFIVASTGAPVALAAGALAVPKIRDAALVLLIGLVAVAAGVVMRIWHLLTRPVVADGEDTLTADLIMRIEDAREAAIPSLQWSLPMVLLFGAAPLWWNALALALVIGGMIVFMAIQVRTRRIGAAARRAMATR